MPDWGPILVCCRKCGHVTRRAAVKVGVLFVCPGCDRTVKTHGIAGQQQATALQLGVIERATRRQFTVMIVAAPAFALAVLCATGWALVGGLGVAWLSEGLYVGFMMSWAVLVVTSWV
ncbi:hypothetical protein LCGC14_2275420, partial [marine sediment metagenome]